MLYYIILIVVLIVILILEPPQQIQNILPRSIALVLHQLRIRFIDYFRVSIGAQIAVSHFI